jgi:hypothetical protein
VHILCEALKTRRLPKEERWRETERGGYKPTRTYACTGVAVKTQEKFSYLLNLLRAADFEPTICSPSNPLIVAVDRQEKIEFELWTKPDGIVFDEQTLRRRRKAQLNEGISAWVVSAEDFIVTKLARPERGVIDEQDVKSVLVRQEGKLDWNYLEKRAKDAQVLTILKTIQNA